MSERSPFPGMDPWLEAYWPSVHHRLIDDLCDRISAGLPQGLFADVEVSVYIVDRDGDEDRELRISDVAVVRSPGPAGSGAAGGAAVAQAAEPFRIRRPPEPFKQGHVVIRSFNRDEPLVTAIEIVSPTNKLGRAERAAYVQKRDRYADGGANVVEIDLVRRGRHLIDVPLADVPAELITPYKAAIRRARPLDDTEVEYYPIPLRQPLPALAIPLRRTDADVVVDLQAILDQVYERARYRERIDYAAPLDPPLAPDDAVWAAERIQSAGLGRTSD